MMMIRYSFNNFVYLFGLALTIILLCLDFQPVQATSVSFRNSIDNNNFCQLQLYQIQFFGGNPDKIIRSKRNRKLRRGRDKSARTIGKISIK